MRRTAGWVALAVAAAGLVAVGVFAVVQMRAPQGPEGPAVPAEGTREPAAEESGKPAIELSGAEVVRRDEQGEVIWRVAASGTMEFDEEQRAVRAEEVNWVLEKGGLGKLTLTAPLMDADYEGKRLLFSEGVLIASDEEDASFRAERMEYQFDTEKLIGSGQVKVKRGGFTGTAPELVIDNRANKVRLRGGVRFTHTGVKIPG